VALDSEQIDRLYRRNARALTVFFARRTWDAETAVDLTAETFAAVFADRAQFRGTSDEDAKSWMYGIAHHQLSAYWRRGAIERRALGRLHVERRALHDSEIERIEELAYSGEVAAHIATQLAHLGPDYAEAVRLRVVEESSYPEVARALGISQVAARARVSRGLRTLALALEEHPLLVGETG